MGAARNVGKGLVDGNPLDEGREIADHFDGGVAQPFVFLEMPTDESEFREEFARLPSRHAAADPEGFGFVRSGKHNSTTDGDEFAAQQGAALPRHRKHPGPHGGWWLFRAIGVLYQEFVVRCRIEGPRFGRAGPG